MEAPVTSTTTTPSSPTAPPSAAGNEGGGEAPFDFAALAAHDDSGEEAPLSTSSPLAPASLDPPASAAPPAPPVAQSPAVEAVSPTPPMEQPAVQPPPVAPTESAPGVPELTIEQHRNKFLPQLAKLYNLTDAEVEGIRVDPGKALPELAAKLHYEVQMATYQGIMSVIPQIVAQAIKGQEASSAQETAFFGKWPALKEAVASNPQAQQVIINAISSYRQVNPRASLEDTIAQAGLLAMMGLRLPLNLQPQTNGAAAAPPSAPMRPPGVGATGHVPMAPGPSAGGEQDIIAGLVDAHLKGEI